MADEKLEWGGGGARKNHQSCLFSSPPGFIIVVRASDPTLTDGTDVTRMKMHHFHLFFLVSIEILLFFLDLKCVLFFGGGASDPHRPTVDLLIHPVPPSMGAGLKKKRSFITGNETQTEKMQMGRSELKMPQVV